MGIRILVVDDDKDLLTLIEKFLVKELPDFEVISTISAQDAVRKLEEERFDAIVCDYYLGVGEMNGLELLEWLRASQSSIPFIMFTGRSREEVAIRALNLGADLYLKKDQEDLETLFVELVHHIKSSVESIQMEKTLREERSRFQKYLDVAGVMIVALDLDGTVTLVNRTGCEILGYDSKEIIGKNWFKTFLPKSLRKEVQRAFTSLMKGDIEPVEYFENPVLTKDGEERIIAWHDTLLTDEAGNITGTLSSGEDITERKEAEEQLRVSEEKYKRLFETSQDGISYTTLDGMHIDVNQGYLDIVGYDREEILSMTYFDITPEKWASAEAEIDKTQVRVRGYSDEYDKEYICKDGTVVPVSIRTWLVKDDGDRPLHIIAVIRDITERKRAEEAIQRSEERFRSIFEGSPIGIDVFDSDGLLIEANKACLDVFGVSSVNDLRGFHLFDDPNIPDDMKKRIRDGETVRFQNEFIFEKVKELGLYETSKSGITYLNNVIAPLDRDKNGSFHGYIVQMQDVTERKIAEDALRASQQLLKRTFDSLNEAVIVLDAETVEIVDCNPATETIFGYSRHELMGKNVNMLHVDEAALEEFRENLYPAMEEKGFLDRFEFRMKRRDGTVFPTEHSVTPLKNEQGTRVGWVSVARDISERKKTEDALRESEKRFRTVFEQAAVGVTIVELDDNIIETNPFYQKLVGYSADELVTMKVADFAHPDDAALDASLTREVLDGKRDSFTMEKRYIRKTGEEIWVELSANFVKDEEGIPEFCIGIVEDITERKKAEEALRESEQRHRTLLQSMEDLVFVIDKSDCYSQYFTAREDLLFVPPEEFLGKHPKDVLPPGISEEYLRCIQDVRHNGKSVTFDYPLQIDEEQHWFSATISRHEDGENIVIAVRTVTDRKRAEEALQESEERHRSLLESLTDGVMVLNHEFRYVLVNEQLARFVRMPLEKLIGSKLADLFPGIEETVFFKTYEQVMETGEPATAIDEFTFEDGRKGWYEAHAYPAPEGLLVVVTEITERKKAEEALREGEVRYHSLFDNTPVGLTFQEIVVDESGRPIDFVFIDVNEGFEALMGLRKDDIVGKSASHVLTSSGEPELDWIDVYGKVALTGARARFDQYSEALGRWFSVTAYSPEKNSFITAYTDVTEQKRAYEDLKQQKKELSDFAHTMSHDLNTYFFKFRGLVHLLESKDEIPEIHRIQLLIAEMSNLVQHSVVLADAGLVIDKKHKLDLAHLVRDVAVRHLPEGIALVQGPLLSVMADEIKLIQIFQNLFANAVEHGSPKTVEVQRYDSMDGVRIVVANDGKQIPNDSRPKVFQSGFTTKGKRRGFGLSIVKKLVEAHGWQIKLVDTPETAFEILIPSAAG